MIPINRYFFPDEFTALELADHYGAKVIVEPTAEGPWLIVYENREVANRRILSFPAGIPLLNNWGILIRLSRVPFQVSAATIADEYRRNSEADHPAGSYETGTGADKMTIKYYSIPEQRSRQHLVNAEQAAHEEARSAGLVPML
ncbi:hypothetical protein EPO44_10270 [bacterium]|nr:MAG: hypothetical protein EPO44_10270 [bacterium]